MKQNKLSLSIKRNIFLRRSAKTIAIAIAVSLSPTINAQTIFSNPVGIGVPVVGAGLDFHVNGPVRINSLATGGPINIVTTDVLGNLNFAPFPGGVVPPGVALGQSLLWDGAIWQPNNFLRVPNFTGAPRIFEVGNGDPATLVRSINYLGNTGITLGGPFGAPIGTWVTHGWRQTNNANPAGDNFVGSRFNWQNFAANVGLTDRVAGPQRDLNVQFQDFTVPATAFPTNRLIFSGVSGLPGGLLTREYATILGNGNMGIGLPNPQVKLHVQSGNIAQVSQGILSPPLPGNRWSALGDRIPFAGPPGVISTGQRTQWDFSAINVGISPDPIAPATLAGLISWQDAAPGPPFTGTNPLIFGARDNTNTNFFERMRITWAGNVGVGTPVPLVKFHVQDGNIAQVSQGALAPPAVGNRWSALGDRVPFAGPPGVLSTGLRTQWDFAAVNFGLTQDPTGTVPNSGLISWQDATPGPPGFGNNSLIFGARDNTNTNFFERMRITWAGNVGIGTAGPNSRLSVIGAGNTAATSSLEVNDQFFNSLMFVRDDGFVGIGTNAPTDRLTVNGNVVPAPIGFPAFDLGINSPFDTWRDVYGVNAYTATSDGRYKTNIKNLGYGLEQVMKLRPVSYEWKTGYNGTRIGFISQEVMEIVPEVVVTPKDDKGAYMMRYSELIPVLVSAIQEQQKQIETLEPAGENAKVAELAIANEQLKAQNTTLENRIKSLEDKLNGICNLPCVQEAIKQNSQQGTLNDQPQLYQNEPNPFGSSTTIKYYVPATAKAAQLKIVDENGKQLAEYALKTGSGQIEVMAGTIKAGSYNYSLYVDNQLVDTKKMLIVNY